MKKIKKNLLEKLIREELRKIISEYDDDTLRYTKADAEKSIRNQPGRIKTSSDGLSPEGHAKVLEEILARLSRIEGKINALSGGAPMSTPR